MGLQYLFDPQLNAPAACHLRVVKNRLFVLEYFLSFILSSRLRLFVAVVGVFTNN